MIRLSSESTIHLIASRFIAQLEISVDLNGQTALVTGSSKNIGQAIAKRLAETGADVGITAHSNVTGCEETLDLVEQEGSTGAISMGDIGSKSDIARIVDEIRTELGHINILVNNAAIRPAKAFEEITIKDWDRVHNVNSRSIFLFAQEIVPDMKENNHGSIINLHGEVVFRGAKDKVHVGASKSSALGMTLSLASTLGPDNIRVNGVSPGRAIKTNRNLGNYDNFQHSLRNFVQATPLRRRGEPKEIADACCFLASDQASFITGQILQVNGGLFPTIHLSSVGLDE